MQFNDLGKQWEEIRETCLQKVDELGYDGGYIGGRRVEQFEREFASYIGSREAVGVSNGTDGLKLALQSFDLNQNDTVIIPANTFIADYLAVKQMPQKEKPNVVLIDHDENFCLDVDQLQQYLMPHREFTRHVVVIAVHLYGHACNMEALMSLKEKYNFFLIEDCSQSHGTKYNGKMTGSFGDVSVFSLYPGKNLGALGDAGILTTDSSPRAEKLRALRNYGSRNKYYYDYMGHNNRLDPIQCIFLSEKLKNLDKWNARKREIAARYLKEINNEKVDLPLVDEKHCEHSYHIFCLRVDNRDSFSEALNQKGIPTIIHYPVPIHRTAIWKGYPDTVYSSLYTNVNADQIISIPIHPFMTEEEVSHVIKTINSL